MSNNYIKVKVKGKNVNNFIKWLIKNNISIIRLQIINHNELEIIINNNDYAKLTKYSKTYNITIIEKYGRLLLIDKIKNNIIIIACLILAIIFIYTLSNVIFSIDIMYNDKEIVEIITKELEKYGIKKYQRKKKYSYLNKVKNQILKDNKDILEWLEIEEKGTKYIIRIVERKKELKNEEYTYQSIVSKKDAIITSIKAISGEKIKTIGQYVKRGDLIVTGLLEKPDGTKLYTKAQGRIYGEVWYKVNIEYPLYYQEERLTGKNKNVLLVYFLNNEIPIFPYNKYKQFKRKSSSLLENNFVPFEVVWEKQYEVIIKEDIYLPEEATIKAIEVAKEKIKSQNHNIIDIKDVKVLDKQSKNSKITLNLFVSTIEDITEIIEIKEEQLNEISS